MKIELHIPPAERRGWPGAHDVSLEDSGRLWAGWSAVRLQYVGDGYFLYATPWQLMRLAGWMVCRRIRLNLERAYRLAAYNTLNAAKRWTKWMTHSKTT